MRQKAKDWVADHKTDIASAFLKVFLIGICFLSYGHPVYGNAQIQQKFTTLYNIVSTIVTSIGGIWLLWGAFEFGQSMNAGEPSATSRALRGIGGGLVMILAPTITSALKSNSA